ncbi:hypothetical protein Bbelb_074480 [Branchiostoma belcheri]|nr:hypothetical protein Bbelb_074480 [Branchiostoma belcheri]
MSNEARCARKDGTDSKLNLPSSPEDGGWEGAASPETPVSMETSSGGGGREDRRGTCRLLIDRKEKSSRLISNKSPQDARQMTCRFEQKQVDYPGATCGLVPAETPLSQHQITRHDCTGYTGTILRPEIEATSFSSLTSLLTPLLVANSITTPAHETVRGEPGARFDATTLA